MRKFLSNMETYKISKILAILTFVILFLNGCNGKFPGADARKYPADPKKRVEQNLAEGRGFTLKNAFGGSKGGTFDFASSNELWRASLDVIDFMPLSSVNYSGGVIITDWYSYENNSNESIKVSIRFLTNEIRSDALDIKIFKKRCEDNSTNCKIIQTQEILVDELTKEILRKAAKYKDENVAKKRKERKKN